MSMYESLLEARAALDAVRDGGDAELAKWSLLPRPPWTLVDELGRQWAHLTRLIREGQVVWGTCFIANEALFDPHSEIDSVAQILHSFDPMVLRQPALLAAVVQKMSVLRRARSSPVPMLDSFAQRLANDYARDFSVLVPDVLTDGLVVYSSTVGIYRRHLPGGALMGGVLPVVSTGERGEPIAVLPPHLWPRALRERWTRDGEAERRAARPSAADG